MSQKKIQDVQLIFTIKEIRQLEVIISNVIFIKGGFKKISKFEKDFWHTLKDICNDADGIVELDSLKQKLH